jgi:hypothetical protein
MIADLVVVVPTRGRPERFSAFLQAWEDTALGYAHLVACLDTDDPTRMDYPKIPNHVGRYSISVPNGFARRLSEEATLVAKHGDAFAIASLNDDHLPRTPGWDREMVAALTDLGAGIVYPDDLLQGVEMPTAPAITADIIRAVGYYVPPRFDHYYIDNVWRAWGILLERYRYLPDVVIEHMHYSAPVPGGEEWERKAKRDRTYTEAEQNQNQVADYLAWQAYRVGSLNDDVQRIREALGL